MKLCPECKKPVVFTFSMAFKEFGCVECDKWGEMFGSGFKEVKSTKELNKLQEERKKKWASDLMYIGINFGGMMCGKTSETVKSCKCEKCETARKCKPIFWRKKNERMS